MNFIIYIIYTMEFTKTMKFVILQFWLTILHNSSGPVLSIEFSLNGG